MLDANEAEDEAVHPFSKLICLKPLLKKWQPAGDPHQIGDVMGEIVRLAEYRDKSAFEAGLKVWRQRFKEPLSTRTRLNDFQQHVLCQLAEPSEVNNDFFYSMILSFLGFGHQATFGSVEKREQMTIVDIHLFLLDHIRFEMMRRLGWLSRFCATQYPLFEMVRQFDQIAILCQQDPPLLSETHPGYSEYKTLIDRDRQVFIRRMMPDALKAFKRGMPV